MNILKYTGDNYDECCNFVGKEIEFAKEEWIAEYHENVLLFKYDCGAGYCYPNDYILEKDDGFHPIRADLFELGLEFISD